MTNVANGGYIDGEHRRLATYDAIAEEYYDDVLHPTCADFRAACGVYLSRFLAARELKGKVADVGCGRSLLSQALMRTGKFEDVTLTLLDSSRKMLAHNVNTVECRFDARVVDITSEPFGSAEFDWVFCILGDPYNTPGAWRHIGRALRPGATAILLVPSARWAAKFRSRQAQEARDAAFFVNRSGEPIYLPSFIYGRADQEQLIAQGGLRVQAYSVVGLDEMPAVSSSKISHYLDPGDPVIEIYEAMKMVGG